MKFFKGFFQARTERLIKENPRMGEDKDLDLNKVELLLYIKLSFRMLKLIAIIFTMSYFLGQFWFIKCDIQNDF